LKNENILLFGKAILLEVNANLNKHNNLLHLASMEISIFIYKRILIACYHI